MTRPKTTRTLDRIANMRRLIEELTKGEMSRSAMMRFLDMSEAGIRAYTNDMRDNDIIKLSRRLEAKQARNGEPAFKLMADSERIEQFLADAAKCDGRKKKPGISEAARNPMWHIHVMQYDGAYPVLSGASVMPDPWALPVEFFRSVGAGVGKHIKIAAAPSLLPCECTV
jgi:hypothetical protein